MSSKKNRQEFRLYKPFYNKETKTYLGTALKMQVRKLYDPEAIIGKRRKILVFLVMTMQTGEDNKGNASFAWNDNTKTVTIKLEPNDIGEMRAVLHGRKDFVGSESSKSLFHKNKRGTTTLTFEPVSGKGFRIRTSFKADDSKVPIRLSQGMSYGEAEIFDHLLGDALTMMFNWVDS